MKRPSRKLSSKPYRKPVALGVRPLDRALIRQALLEDLGSPRRDLTNRALARLYPRQKVEFTIHSKQAGEIVLAGTAVITEILRQVDRSVRCSFPHRDGAAIPFGGTLAVLRGSASSLLSAERTVLNYTRHLCAVATITARFVDITRHTKAKILDTRKTTPGLRHLEKYAVACGGGVNHRMGLYDAIMIKNNHVDLVGGMRAALEALPMRTKKSPSVIVETRSIEEVSTVLGFGRGKVSRVLLDNMDLSMLRECVILCEGILETEASGGITLENARAIAETGVDFLSVGMLTHSAGNVDLSMGPRK